GDAVDARRVGNVADDLVRIQIDDDDVRSVRDVEPSRGAVDREVVPAAFAADLDVAEDVITGGGGERQRDRHERTERREDQSSHRTLLGTDPELYREVHERTMNP